MKMRIILSLLLALLISGCATTVEHLNYFQHPLEKERIKIHKECLVNPDYFGYTMSRIEYNFFRSNGFEIRPTPGSYCYTVSKELVFGNKVG